MEGVTKNIVTIGGKEYIYWRARYSRPGYTPKGKRQREAKQFKTEREAREWLRKALREAPRAADDSLTVAEWVPMWLDYKGSDLKPKTREQNERIFRNHILPLFGHKRLDRVTVDDIYALLKDIRRKGLDENKVFNVARSAFTQARRLDRITSSPFDRVPTPRTRDTKTQILDEAQCRRLLETINGDRLSPLFTLLTVTGVRLGEALGLTWDRVDLEAGKIEVRQELQWLEDRYAHLEGKLHAGILRAIPYHAKRAGKLKPYLLTPKTKNGKRDIFLAAPTIKVLRAHRTKQAERFGIKADGLVFVTDEGTPYLGSNVRRALDGYTEKAKLPRVTPKGLRHSQNNFQRVVGIETVARSAGLGHLPSVNQNIYSHATEQELRKAAKLSARLIPA